MAINPNITDTTPVAETHSSERPIILYEVFEALGRRSFIPFIALPALIGLTRAGTSMVFAVLTGLLFVWIGGQLLVGYAFPALPSKIAYMRSNGRLANYFTMRLLDMVEWLDQAQSPRLSWLTTSAFASLPYVTLIAVGLMLPILNAMGQSTFLVFIAALIYCVALLTRDGRYVLAAASVLSIASISPVLQLAS